MTFRDLQLNEQLLRALEVQGYTQPTPIQGKAIPHILNNKDVLGIAQTGTGKTAAFALPIIQLMTQHHDRRGNVACLILTPTRELALQIAESFGDYGQFSKLRSAVIFGGVSQHQQVETLRRGVDILIATPGRLLDLMQQKIVKLNDVRWLILDEADRMLDMGFVHDVKRIIASVPRERQTLFFSATMPPAITELAGSILRQPVRVEVTPPATTAEMVRQEVYFIDKGNKRHLLRGLLSDQTIERVLVFTRTKHGADKVARDLVRSNITAQAIHGNKSQNARQAALQSFKAMKTRVLVATDIAARGIDIDLLSHVIQFDLPNVPETYVHRIGRTGRAGAEGIAIAFCDQEERAYLRDIEKTIGKKVPVADAKAILADLPPAPAEPEQQSRPAPANGQPNHRRRDNGNRNGRPGNRPRPQQSNERKQTAPNAGPSQNKPKSGSKSGGRGSVLENLSRRSGRNWRDNSFPAGGDLSY